MMGDWKTRVASAAKERQSNKRKSKKAPCFADACRAYSLMKRAQSLVDPVSLTDEMRDRLAKEAGL